MIHREFLGSSWIQRDLAIIPMHPKRSIFLDSFYRVEKRAKSHHLVVNSGTFDGKTSYCAWRPKILPWDATASFIDFQWVSVDNSKIYFRLFHCSPSSFGHEDFKAARYDGSWRVVLLSFECHYKKVQCDLKRSIPRVVNENKTCWFWKPHVR